MIVARLLSLVLGVLALPSIAAAQVFTTYDAFTGPLSPALWAGLETNTNFAVISNTETHRAVVKPDPLAANRFLQLGLTTAHPGSGSDTGEAGQGRQRVRIVRDDIVSGAVTVTGFRTRVTMLSTAVTACPTTTDASPTRAMAQVSFFFFNDGSSTGPTDPTGDVFAGFNVEQSSVSGRIIGAFLGRCTNATCSTIVTDKFQTFVRRWAVGVAVPLTVVWDHTNDQFIYTAGTEQHALTYGEIPLTDTAPPVADTRDLQARNVLPNCTTPVRASATARYDFLQIATESGVFPSSPMIDQQQPSIDSTVGGAGIGSTTEAKLAQVVTQGVTGFVMEVRLPVACDSVSDLVVELQGVAADRPNGVVLTSQTIPGATLPPFFPSPPEFRSLPFAAPVRLSAGDRFAIVLSSAGECGIFQGPVGDSYPGGNVFGDVRPNTSGVWESVCDFPGAHCDLPFQTVVASSA